VKPEWTFTVGPQRLAAVAPVAQRGPEFAICPRANSHLGCALLRSQIVDWAQRIQEVGILSPPPV